MKEDLCKSQMTEIDRGPESFPRAWSGALPHGFSPPKVKLYQFILSLKAILPPPQGEDAETVGQKPSGGCDSHSVGCNQC